MVVWMGVKQARASSRGLGRGRVQVWVSLRKRVRLPVTRWRKHKGDEEAWLGPLRLSRSPRGKFPEGGMQPSRAVTHSNMPFTRRARASVGDFSCRSLKCRVTSIPFSSSSCKKCCSTLPQLTANDLILVGSWNDVRAKNRTALGKLENKTASQREEPAWPAMLGRR